jgi:hypothetical protein
MNVKSILKSPVRQTILVVIISGVVSLILSLILLYVNRVANAEFLNNCTNVTFCLARRNVVSAFLYDILGDFSTVTRYIAELGVVVLITQLIYRVIKRR